MSLSPVPLPTRVVEQFEGSLASAHVDAARVGEDLFGLADLLLADARLRRALTDPSRSDEDKATLARAAFASRLHETTMLTIETLVGEHWSRPAHLPPTLEAFGVRAIIRDAQRAGALSQLEEELFHVQEFLRGHRELRVRLSDMGEGSPHERADVAERLFAPHVSVWTMRLLRRAVGRSVHGRLIQKLRDCAEEAARAEKRQLVTVETAAPLSEQQSARLRALMAARLGTEVTLAVTIDPEVVGGFRLRAGTEAIDASVSTRVSQVRRELVG